MLAYKILRKLLQWFKNKNVNKKVLKSISIICNNCIGGIIYSDLKLQFNSPTINLFFYGPDYIKFIEDLKYYISQNIHFSFESKYFEQQTKYPVGKLHDIEIHFLHYHDFHEAENDWYKRAERVDFENLFVIGSDRDLCNDEIKRRFAKLPFKNKIFFTSKPSNYKHEIFFEEYIDSKCVGDLIADDKAWYFYFDVVHWINTGIINKNYLSIFFFKKFRKVKKKLKIKESSIS
jgi:uncharacterized protein (DUF1919 family)